LERSERHIEVSVTETVKVALLLGNKNPRYEEHDLAQRERLSASGCELDRSVRDDP